jgi:mono/diheme cytochrome c family protein
VKHMVRRVIAVLASMLIVGGAWLACSMAYFPITSLDIDAGRRLFHNRCSSCHSVDAGGSSSYGPNLSRIGAVAADRVAGMSPEEYLIESILRPGGFRQKGEHGVMPADIASGLTSREVLDIVAYLMTQGGSPHYRRLTSMRHKIHISPPSETLETQFDSAEAGKDLFINKGACLNCHPLRATPGFNLRAPSLLAAGQHGAAHLLESIREPSKTIASGYEVWHVQLLSGKSYSGRLVRRSEDSIDLIAEQPGGSRMMTIPLADIDLDGDGTLMLRRSTQSAMPDYQATLSMSEMELIVQFLMTLR